MKNLRTYGNKPFKIAVIHGGPGASGEMAPVAELLSSNYGVLEPLQTSKTINGQIEELKNILEKDADLPLTLIGFSWGAWLGLLFAAKHPEFVAKIILIGSGGFEEKYTLQTQETRLSRLTDEEKDKVEFLGQILNDSNSAKKNEAFCRLGKIFSKADSYDSIIDKNETINCNFDIYQNVWNEASRLRKSGKLLKIIKKIKCPVVAIHGDFDSHPAKGTQKSLKENLKDFRFILLKNCGHKPWMERQAMNNFYEILKEELKNQ
ncbi:MAG: alpha/beta hydrolase [Bacteroidales bacterium]|nr:alpha/beta hydrolase [Bacteroidales bacterium]